jgi:hypothetical protein
MFHTGVYRVYLIYQSEKVAFMKKEVLSTKVSPYIKKLALEAHEFPGELIILNGLKALGIIKRYRHMCFFDYVEKHTDKINKKIVLLKEVRDIDDTRASITKTIEGVIREYFDFKGMVSPNIDEYIFVQGDKFGYKLVDIDVARDGYNIKNPRWASLHENYGNILNKDSFDRFASEEEAMALAINHHLKVNNKEVDANTRHSGAMLNNLRYSFTKDDSLEIIKALIEESGNIEETRLLYVSSYREGALYYFLYKDTPLCYEAESDKASKIESQELNEERLAVFNEWNKRFYGGKCGLLFIESENRYEPTIYIEHENEIFLATIRGSVINTEKEILRVEIKCIAKKG